MRVKRGVKARRRRNKVLDRAEGYRGSGSRVFSVAKEMNDRGMVFAYRDRKQRKREFRKLWITRISAAAKQNGTSYSKLMGALTSSKINLDRKVLSDMAIFDPEAFTQIVQQVLPK
ncbi:MAG: 50S ribosomal protein L20 [Bdellovibrionales bacterium]|nr:50S ribosomal protein L20 [Bdellovibrionales bacterium]